jgi:hypothetical protein
MRLFRGLATFPNKLVLRDFSNDKNIKAINWCLCFVGFLLSLGVVVLSISTSYIPVVDNLLEQEHTLGGKLIDVKCYQALLKGPEVQSRERVFRVPDSIDLSHIEPRVIEFCHTVPFYRKKLEEELSKEYGNLKWPSKSNKTALIECTLDFSAPGCFKRAKIWTERIMKIVNVFIGDLSLIKLDVLPDIWDSLTEHLKSISIKKT